MLEQIYCTEINLDDDGNFTVDITKDNAVDRKKLLAGEEYLLRSLSIKPVRSNEITKWDKFSKIEAVLEKINNAKRTKSNSFDSTITVSMEGTSNLKKN